MLGRYGKHLTGSDVREDGHDLESLDFDDETRELIGLDDIDEILGEINEDAELDVEEMEQKAEAVKTGDASTDIKDSEEVIAEMDEPGSDGTDDSIATGASDADNREFESETN